MDVSEAPGRLPPQNVEAEQCVLGSMLLDRECVGDLLLTLEAEDFYVPAHAEIFAVLCELFDGNQPIDLVIATNQLEKRGKLALVGGVDTLVGLMEAVPSAAHAEAYAALVKAASQRRRLVQAAHEILRDCYDGTHRETKDLIDEAEQRIFGIAHDEAGDASADMETLVKVAMEKVEALRDGDPGQVTNGLRTRFTELDRLLNGLNPGALYIIAGRPSMGKSSFATSLLDNVAVRDQVPCALFTLEVTKEQVAENMLCGNARVDAHRLMRGELSSEDYDRVPVAAGRLAQAPLYIDDSPGMTLTRLRAKARRMVASHGVQMLVVDYLQLLTVGGSVESRQIEISRLSGGLKQLARELKVPVLALSQLNRGVEARTDKRPMMGDLRESGSIEQDADAVLLLYRHEYYDPTVIEAKGKAEVIVAKNRNGPTGSVELNFHANMMRFDNPLHLPDAAPPAYQPF